MSSATSRLVARLESAVGRGAFLDACSYVVDELNGLADRANAIEPILRLMEDNPTADFGTPGPLVHWLEEFAGAGYEQALAESLSRRPTTHTVWMLNRLINGAEGDEQTRLLGLMRGVACRPGLEAEVAAQATEFLECHGDR